MTDVCRTCTACKWFYVESADYGYSEYTPSGPMHIECLKSHWRFDPYNLTCGILHKMFTTAETCPDFEVSDEIKNL